MKIKELKQLLQDCTNPAYKRQLEVDIVSYSAIKNIFDSIAKK